MNQEKKFSYRNLSLEVFTYLTPAPMGLKRYCPRVWSSMVKRLEDDCGEDLRASGFSEYLVDQEPEEPGEEVVVANRSNHSAV